MNPNIEHLPKDTQESFVIKYFDYPYFPTPWHYHPEFELVLVTESTGKRYIGDNISDFQEMDLAIIGPNLPHTYKNDESYHEKDSKKRAKSIVIHFSKNSLGNDFLSLPEAQKINYLLDNCKGGFDIKGKTNKEVSKIMREMLNQKGIVRWCSLLSILALISESDDLTQISNANLVGVNDKESERLSKIIDYIYSNYMDEIKIADIAKITNMTETSLSRFFIQRTRKSLSAFLMEIRLHNACTMLQKNNLNISEIGYQNGFNNLSNFNRQFKKHYLCSPKEYRRQFLEKAKLLTI
jgi:AraC-like DNA-binding protein